MLSPDVEEALAQATGNDGSSPPVPRFRELARFWSNGQYLKDNEIESSRAKALGVKALRLSCLRTAGV